MKFECDSCHAQYMIADDKVGKRGVKVKCKRCAHVIIVRPDALAAARLEEQKATDSPAQHEGGEAAPDADSADTLLGLSRPAAEEPPPDISDRGESEFEDKTQVAPPAAIAALTEAMGRPEPTVVQARRPDDEPAAPPPPPTEVMVRPAMAARADKQASAHPGGASIAGESSIGDALDMQLAGAFNQMFDEAIPGVVPATDDRGPTRVLDVPAIEELRRMTGDSGASPPVPPPPLEAEGRIGGADDGAAEAVWHVAIEDEDVGPISLAEIGRHIEAGRVDRDTLVWRPGLDNWQAATEISEIRTIFDTVPMPKIARSDERRVGPGFDVGAPIDDGAPTSSPFDAPAAFPEESDPTWRPHGLTAVYQAANLAESAGAAVIGLAAESGSGRGSLSAAASLEPEWRPSASSALASLVNDEMGRLTSGPPPAADDDLAVPPAVDDSLPSTPFAGLTGALDAGHELGDRSARPEAAYPAAFAPAAVPARSPQLWLLGGIGTLLVVLLLIVVVKLFQPPAPVVVVGAGPAGVVPLSNSAAASAPASGPAGLVPAVAGATTVPTVPASAAASAATDPAPGAAAPAADAPSGTAATALPSEPQSAQPPAEPAKVAVAEPKAVKRDRPAAPKPAREAPPKKEAAGTSNGGCDPILDIDCKAKSGGGAKVSSGKETLEKSDILPVVKEGLGKVKDCGRKNKVQGSIKMTWKINKDGRAADVTVGDSKFAGTPVGNCVVGVVKTWRFPSYSGKAPPPVSIPLPLN